MSSKPELQSSLAALRRAFAAQLPDRFEAIAQQHRPLLAGTGELAHLQELVRLVHSLAGTGRTYGFQAVGLTAKEIEQALQPALEAGQLPAADTWQGLQGQLDELKRLCDEAATVESATPHGHDHPAAQGGTLIFLLEDDYAQGAFLAAQLGHFGYDVRLFQDIDALTQALAEHTPKAQIYDIVTREGPMAGIELAARLKQGHGGEAPPVIFTSSREDVTARLEAVRAGGAAYLTKPVDINQIVDVLDHITSKSPPKPYRVLIIDDEKSVASFHEALLRQAGMETAILTKPLDALSTIQDFAPELILMDMYMPECTGHELAQIIRQHGAYTGIPIIFLSAEKNTERQYDALRTGADDFLTKPIDPQALIRSVTIRAERARLVNALMVRDSMTGLLNHARSKEMLATEIERARRNGSNLSVAMIDIDKFKSINDTYGHPVGDRVIKSLSRLIKERLRASDIAGRYGGEEFVLILPDCSVQEAARIVDDLRIRFGEIQHCGDKQNVEFSATFSSGVANFPICGSVEQIILTADAALYEAKHRGRNRVIMATKAVESANKPQ